MSADQPPIPLNLEELVIKPNEEILSKCGGIDEMIELFSNDCRTGKADVNTSFAVMSRPHGRVD